jgi:hypothetical protein
MNEELLIIFGAGAAHDCVDINKIPVNSSEHKPPLTKDLFNPYNSDEEGEKKINIVRNALLIKHKHASSLTVEFDQENESLENFLMRLRNIATPSRRRQYIAIYFYLRDLFREVGEKYLSSPISNNYYLLLRKLQTSSFKKINLLTTNYELILDKTLENMFNHRFQKMTDYLNFNGDSNLFNYIKIHGSINWSYLLNEKCAILNNEQNLINGDINIDENIISFIFNASNVFVHSNPMPKPNFPAIAAPLGSYKNVHEELINNFIHQGFNLKNVLIIGYSGRDNTVFDLLKTIIKNEINIFIVDKDEESVASVSRAFKSNLNNLVRHTTESINYFPCGFTRFINEHSDSWLKRITNSPH